jgi:hypothetical protein
MLHLYAYAQQPGCNQELLNELYKWRLILPAKSLLQQNMPVQLQRKKLFAKALRSSQFTACVTA